MKYCTKCGKGLADNVRICPDCGNDTAEGVVIQQTIVQPQKENQTNGMAIAGFVCAFFFPFLGFIFGIIGLARSRRLGNAAGLSVAAILISGITIGLIIFAFKFAFDYIRVILYLIGLE